MFPSVTLHSTQSINKMALLWLWPSHCPLLHWRTAFFPWCFKSVLLQIHLIPRTPLWHGSLSFCFYENKLGQLRGGTVILRNNHTDYNWKSRIKYLFKINKKEILQDFPPGPGCSQTLRKSFILKTKLLSHNIAITFSLKQPTLNSEGCCLPLFIYFSELPATHFLKKQELDKQLVRSIRGLLPTCFPDPHRICTTQAVQRGAHAPMKWFKKQSAWMFSF